MVRRIVDQRLTCLVVVLATGCTELAVVGNGGASGATTVTGDDASASTAAAQTTTTSSSAGTCAPTWQRTIDGQAGIEHEGELFWASGPGVARLDPCSGATLSTMALEHAGPTLFVHAVPQVLVAGVTVDPDSAMQRGVVQAFDPTSEAPTIAPILFEPHMTVSLRGLSFDPAEARAWLAGGTSDGGTFSDAGLWSATLAPSSPCAYSFERDELVFAEIIEGRLVTIGYDGDDDHGPLRRSIVSAADVIGCNVAGVSRTPLGYVVHAAQRVGGVLYLLGEENGAVVLERWNLTMLGREATVTVDVTSGVDEGRSLASDGERLWIGGAADVGLLTVATGFAARVPLDFLDGADVTVTRFDDIRGAQVTAGREALYVSGSSDFLETTLRKCTHDVVCN